MSQGDLVARPYSCSSPDTITSPFYSKICTVGCLCSVSTSSSPVYCSNHPSQAFPSILLRVSLPSKAVACLWLKPVGTAQFLPHLTSWKHQASLASLSRTILFFPLQQHLSFSFPFWQFFLKFLHGRPFFHLSFINCFFC